MPAIIVLYFAFTSGMLLWVVRRAAQRSSRAGYTILDWMEQYNVRQFNILEGDVSFFFDLNPTEPFNTREFESGSAIRKDLYRALGEVV